MTGPPLLDAADLDLVAALQRAPRAGTRLLAEVLGTSPSTVSRRLARLRDAEVLRVIGQIDWSALADTTPHHVWLDAVPGRAQDVAAAVAALPESQYVALVSGTADVYAILQAERRADSAGLLTERIGAIDGLVSSRTETVLRSYASAATWTLPRLSAAQRKRLYEENPEPEPSERTTLAEDERAALALLQADGRANAADLSRALGASQSTAYRLAQSLLERGLVRPRVEIEPALLGYPLEAVVSLTAELAALPALARALGSHPTARFVSTVAGASSLIYHGAFRDERDLSDLLTGDLAALKGVKDVDICVALRVLTRYWLPRDGFRVRGGGKGADRKGS